MLAQVQGDPEEEFLGLRMGCDGSLPRVFWDYPNGHMADRPQEVVAGHRNQCLWFCCVESTLDALFYFPPSQRRFSS